jgi:Skp family chaperone for outer membrane proteins
LIERAKVLHTPRQKEETMTSQQITAAYMPALMIMVTVYIAAVSNKKRIDDVNNRIGDVNQCIDELRADFKEEIKALRTEMKDLRTEMKEGFRKLEERFEHPIARP